MALRDIAVREEQAARAIPVRDAVVEYVAVAARAQAEANAARAMALRDIALREEQAARAEAGIEILPPPPPAAARAEAAAPPPPAAPGEAMLPPELKNLLIILMLLHIGLTILNEALNPTV
jgi:hypothetical protein